MNKPPDAYTLALRELSALLRRMRELTPRTPSALIPHAELDLSRFEQLGETLMPRAVITLRSTGCDWVRRSGGCTMCGHWAGAMTEATPDPDTLYAQFERAFERVNWEQFPVLCLYNGGSVLSREEVPDAAFERILGRILSEPRIRVVALETRPEFVEEERLRRLSDGLRGRTLRVAMGLESAREDIRQLSIHKGVSRDMLAQAAARVTPFAQLRFYVLIKPPWLTETEAIDDAVDSVRLAFELGATDVHFEPATVQRHTLVHQLWRLSRYRLPWLWSIREILRRLDKAVYVSPFAHVPAPIAIPHNCPTCSPALTDAIIRRYNRTGDAACLDAFGCPCEAGWRESLVEHDPRDLPERVLADVPLLRDAIETDQP